MSAELIGGPYSPARATERFWEIATLTRCTASRKPYTTQKKLNAAREKSTNRIGRKTANRTLAISVASVKRRQNS